MAFEYLPVMAQAGSPQTAARLGSAIESSLVSDYKTCGPIASCALVERGATP